MCKTDYSWNPSTCICVNSKYLKSTSKTECDKIITVMDIASTKKTIGTNVTSTASINCHSIKVKRLLYFTHPFISNDISTDNYYYLLSLCKTKRNNIKWKIMN